ncbi:MAG: NAD-dependent epimerase/dehydratase family protein [Saprospiraceae bacterium]|nr:NAD-dependent epimerase/dehydratase family protein [Saprospiraceae bacterium]
MKVLVIGSSGLIGSEAVRYYGKRGHQVMGIDNNQRMVFFGAAGDTTWNLKQLLKENYNYQHFNIDIRDRQKMLEFYKEIKPDVTIHCAAQPSHDLAAKLPFDDFDTNAIGTLNLLEANRQYSLDSPFIYMSTNKVYGDAPNELNLQELQTRWDYADSKDYHGIDEDMRIDQTKHSLFGASKAAADLITQEYGLYFNMPTVCFRGGCLTGPNHSGVELHGFLSFLVKAAINKIPYTIFGYKGKQVRDQIHSEDVIEAFQAFVNNPRAGAVYNLGGGRNNSASILECINLIKELSGHKLMYTLSEKNRIGDHICYISNIGKFKSDFPNWDISKNLEEIITEIIESEQSKK